MTDFELDLLNRYIEKVNTVFSLCTKGTPIAEQIDRCLDNLGDVWNRCLQNKATLGDFKAALDQWYSVHAQIVVRRRKPQKRGLTVKEQRFIKAYGICGNASSAARQAGYSPKTCRQIACKILKKPYIRKAIENESG